MWSLRRNPFKIATGTPLTLHADKIRLLHIIRCECASKCWCILNTLMTKILADYYIFTITNCRKIKIVWRRSYQIFVNTCIAGCSILPATCWYGFILPIHFRITSLMARESYGQTLPVKQPLENLETHWTTPPKTGDINTNNSTTAIALITRFMGPTWGPSGADRTQVGPCWPHGLGILYVVPDSQDLCIRLDQLWSDSARQIYLWAQTLSSIDLHSFTRY